MGYRYGGNSYVLTHDYRSRALIEHHLGNGIRSNLQVFYLDNEFYYLLLIGTRVLHEKKQCDERKSMIVCIILVTRANENYTTFVLKVTF